MTPALPRPCPWSDSRRRFSARGPVLPALIFGALLLTVLVSDVAGLPGCANGCKTATASAAAPLPPPAPPRPLPLGVAPANGSEDLSPLSRVKANVVNGTLTQVTLVDDYGNTVDGVPVARPDLLAADAAAEVQPHPHHEGGQPGRQRGAAGPTTTFGTATPNNVTQVYLETPAACRSTRTWKYGVGTIIAARFDEPIADKGAGRAHLRVTTNPPVKGVGTGWTTSPPIGGGPRYIPRHHGGGGGQHLGSDSATGLYGPDNATATFTIGDAHISIADDRTKTVSVFDNGKLVRAMPTSMGKAASRPSPGASSFWDPARHLP